nr:NifU family protein [Bradyrhizobium niftali]
MRRTSKHAGRTGTTEAITTDRERRIRGAIEAIGPNLQRGGGDCHLIEMDGSRIMVRLSAARTFRKLSSVTLKGIQARGLLINSANWSAWSPSRLQAR